MADPASNFGFDSIELAAVRRRRAHYSLTDVAATHKSIGIALSGGGIRAATFSLGIMQGLSHHHLLHRFDFLSTVSGGSYVGSFYGGLFVPRGDAAPIIAKAADGSYNRDVLGTPRALNAVAWLRQSARYLAPSGAGDYLYAFGLLARNWVTLQIVLGLTLLALALTMDSLRLLLSRGLHLGLEARWAAHPVGSMAGSGIALGHWLLPELVVAVGAGLLCVASGWAYWLTRRDFVPAGIMRFVSFASIGTLVVAVWASLAALGARTLAAHLDSVLIAVAAVGALAAYAWSARAAVAASAAGDQQPKRIAREDSARVRLTKSLAFGLKLLLFAAALGTVDALAYLLCTVTPHWGKVNLSFAPGALALPVAHWLGSRVQKPGVRQTLTRGAVAVFTSGFALWLTIVWIALAHWLIMADPVTFAFADRIGIDNRWVTLAAATIVTLGIGVSYSFLNLSSLSTFYAGRLRRAYLGASNPFRIGDPDPAASQRTRMVTDSEEHDDVQPQEYFNAAGAPVHLINISLNATRGSASNIIQRDRHAKALTVGPAGVLYTDERAGNGLGHIAFNDGEPLPMSTWVAISGAAVSTGMGSYTSTVHSLLTGLVNARLGYWWRSSRSSGLSVPTGLNDFVQNYLYREFFAEFDGSDLARWNLSDGGHFDNSGIYELVRRELALIIAVDSSEDPAYRFSGIADLIRKVRIDFGAEIAFADHAALDGRFSHDPLLRASFAPPAGFVDQPDAVAALAAIAYRSGRSGLLVVLKPRVTAAMPRDLCDYQRRSGDGGSAAFPHQTTLDQFYDETQWESYAALGREVAAAAFRSAGTTLWPGTLIPADKPKHP